MRLTTLARKVGRTPSQIITFLELNQIELSNSVNTKLDDAVVALVLKEFEIEPEIPQEPIVEQPIESAQIITEVPVVAEEIVTDSAIEIAETEIPMEVNEVKVRTGTIDDLETGDATEIEHIKAKKVKLEGFKVVGKIELPQKPIKSPASEEETLVQEDSKKSVPERPQRKQKPEYQKHERHPRHHRQPLSYEERLKKEEQTRKQEIQKKLEEEKARKQRYYEKHIAPKTIQKPAKKKPQTVKSSQTQSEKTVLYKNPIRRFLAWINGKYDKF